MAKTLQLEKGMELTKREQEILSLVWAGATSKHIADTLKISRKTVEAHRANIMHKWRVNNVAQLCKLGLQAGLLKVA